MARAQADTWIDLFDRRAREGLVASVGQPQPRSVQLHHLAGWHDVADGALWRSYVLDAVDGLFDDGDSIFEAGCGVLAYLRVIADKWTDLDLSGVDGSAAAINVARAVAAQIGARPPQFSVGILPDCLENVPSDRFDVTICHSVMQYIGGRASAEQLVCELIRITKPGGSVHLGDLWDAARSDENEAHAQRHWGGQRLSLDISAMQRFDAEWFHRFEPGVTLSDSRSRIQRFGRQELRFNMTLKRRLR